MNPSIDNLPWRRHGRDVWKYDRKTAVKAFKSLKNYSMELRCYQRLRQHKVTKIREFAVPRLVDSNSALLVIEMDFISPPCVLDFGKAYLDYEPDHSAETWAEHHAAQRELWEDKYAEVQAVLWSLKQIGIYLSRRQAWKHYVRCESARTGKLVTVTCIPRKAFLYKTKKLEYELPLGTFRCSSCGNVELYAGPDFAAK